MSRRRLTIALVVGLAWCCGAAQAFASPIFSQTPVMNTAGLSDPAGGYLSADDFSLASAAVVRSVMWQGLYSPSGSPPAVDDFTVTFYSSTAGLPGGLLQSFNVGNAVNKTATGTLLGGTLFSYSADLGAGIALAGSTTYWISVVNDTTADTNDSWYHGTLFVPSTQTNAVSSNGGANWGPDYGTNYFVLDNANLPAPASVPEPATLLLLGTGLAGLGVTTWRRARRK